MRIGIVTGTMPDIIKQAPLVWEAEKRGHDVTLIHSGQHLDHKRFSLIAKSIGLRKPDVILAKHFSIPWAISQIQSLIQEHPMDIILTHGDTNTAMAVSVGAHYAGIPVGHVEAGLRTKSREPWPEQTNTRIVDACSSLFFAPTKGNVTELVLEGFNLDNILKCGNTVVDIIKLIGGLSRIPYSDKIYFSAHREENMRFKDRLLNIVKFAEYLALADWEVMWVMRPKTESALKAHGLSVPHGVQIIDSLTYPESLGLLRLSRFVCTDSGGLQEEASALHVPCLTMRYVTDRPETVDAVSNVLLTLDFEQMVENYKKALANYEIMAKADCPYGNGNTAELIMDFIEKREGNFITWEGV